MQLRKTPKTSLFVQEKTPKQSGKMSNLLVELHNIFYQMQKYYINKVYVHVYCELQSNIVKNERKMVKSVLELRRPLV